MNFPVTGIRAIFAAMAFTLVCMTTSVFGAAITYNVNQTVGAGSIIGTITTDGTIGTLTVTDFTAWSLTVTGAGGATLLLNEGNSAVMDYTSGECNSGVGNCTPSADVTATSTELLFNFAGTDAGYWGFQKGPLYTGNTYVCFATENQTFDCAPGETVAPISAFDRSFQQCNPSPAGNGLIGTVAPSAANLCGVTTGGGDGGGGGGGTSVPEPSTPALMGMGLVGLGLFRSKRAKART